MGCQEVGTDRGSGRSGSVGPRRHAVSQPWRVRKPEPLANPLLGKWLCVLKDARPCRISSAAILSNLVGANSHRRSLSLLSTPRENCSCPNATRDHARSVLSMFASGFLLAHPWRITASTRELVKSDSKLPPAEPFATGICAARNREWLFG